MLPFLCNSVMVPVQNQNRNLQGKVLEASSLAHADSEARVGGLLDLSSSNSSHLKRCMSAVRKFLARYLSNRASPRGLSYSAVLRINRTPREIVCPESTFNSLDIPTR